MSPGYNAGKNYGGEEEIVPRKDGTFSHSFVRDGRVILANVETWLFAKDSAEIVFSSAAPVPEGCGEDRQSGVQS